MSVLSAEASTGCEFSGDLFAHSPRMGWVGFPGVHDDVIL